LRHFVACVEKMHFVEQLILTVPAPSHKQVQSRVAEI
jgi:hypothetical protein